jgi:hypothetical protein
MRVLSYPDLLVLMALSKRFVSVVIVLPSITYCLESQHGVLDLVMASRTLLRDWNHDKILWYTQLPASPATSDSQSDPEFAELYAKDIQVLSSLKNYKEMNKAGGLVKLATGRVDPRGVLLDATWSGVAADEVAEVESQGEVGSEDDSECLSGMDDDGNDDEEASTAPRKRKRGSAKGNTPPTKKKVAFSTSSKSRRSGIAEKVGKGVANAVLESRKDQSDQEAYDFQKFF